MAEKARQMVIYVFLQNEAGTRRYNVTHAVLL
jgi:hypothetical protein